MKKSRLLSAVCGCTFVFTATSHAALTEIDFNNLSAGVQVIDQFSTSGLTFSMPDSEIDGPTTFSLDGNNIYGATGIAIVPGDDELDPFYDIEITFSTIIDYFSIYAINAEEPFTLLGYRNDTLVGSQASSTTYFGRYDGAGGDTFDGPVFF